MENSLETLAINLNLGQSELFKEYYDKPEIKQIHTFNELSIKDLTDWYNSVLNKYVFLNPIQVENFQAFWNSLEYVLSKIDPLKLKIKTDSNEEEQDLLLWRESSKGLSKLSFDSYGQITYMFNGFDGKKIRGVFDSDVDMEKLLFRFIRL
ncbi:MAG TPA: hypothetical protein VJU52_10695 [Flavobacterium sp.]|nr:hypothetical protein [Flavobacterium sp.]